MQTSHSTMAPAIRNSKPRIRNGSYPEMIRPTLHPQLPMQLPNRRPRQYPFRLKQLNRNLSENTIGFNLIP